MGRVAGVEERRGWGLESPCSELSAAKSPEIGLERRGANGALDVFKACPASVL